MIGEHQLASPLVVAIAFLLAVAGTIAVAIGYRRLRGTTLVGAQGWLGGCQLAVGLVEVWLACGVERGVAASAEPLRYVAATLTFCPLMALLGAKRPQDRAWHFIVFSLWIVLALPAVHVWLIRSGQSLSTPPALSWFMLGLVVIGVLNRLMTAGWLGGLLFGCGQVSLLSSHLPLFAELQEFGGYPGPLVGLGLIVSSTLLFCWTGRAVRPDAEPLDRLWVEFRDLFGVFWALRLAERVNSASELGKSGLVLRWSGFQTTTGGRISDTLSPDAVRVLRQGLENLLRRFVSRAWIAERLQESDKLTGEEYEPS